MAANVFELQAARARHGATRRRRLPVQGPGLLRRRGRRVLLRARAARRRARRPPHRRPADRDRRRRRAAASPPCCAPGCSPRWRPACCPGSERWPIARAAARRAPAARSSSAVSPTATAGRSSPSTSSRSSSPPAATRRERAAFADALVRRAPGPARDRAGRGPRRLLRALRGVPGARRASWRRATCSSGRCAATSCAARSSCRRGAPGCEVEPELADALLADVEGRPGALPLLSTALLELWQHRDGRRLRMSAYEQAGGVQGAVARLAERAYERLEPGAACGGAPDPAAARRRRRRGRRPPPRSRWTSSTATTARSSPCSPTSAWSRSARTRSRWRTRRCCANGRGCAAGSRRTRRAGGCTRTCARPRAAGRTRGAIPGELYRGARLAAALEWVGRARRRAQRRRARLRRREPRGEPALAAPAASGRRRPRRAARAGARRRRGRARPARAAPAREATAAEAQRLGARALVEDDLDLSLLLARQGVALDDTPQTRGNLLAALLKTPGRDRRAARRRRSRDRPRRSARTSARWPSSTPTAR